MSDLAAAVSSPLDNLTPDSSTPAAPALQVIKRTGNAVPFDDSKIAIALTKAFLAVEGQEASGSARVKTTVAEITGDIAARLRRRLPPGGSVHIEDIQDQVELGLMRHGFQKVARAYVLYREEHNQKRAAAPPATAAGTITLVAADGSERRLDLGDVERIIRWACAGIADVDPA